MIIYNKIHNQYNLPLGLHFSLYFNKIEYPNQWISTSNIPALDYFIYTGIEDKQAILELIKYIFSNLESIEKHLINSESFLNIDMLDKNQILLFNKIIKRYNQ